jgi:hypothetical protein
LISSVVNKPSCCIFSYPLSLGISTPSQREARLKKRGRVTPGYSVPLARLKLD